MQGAKISNVSADCSSGVTIGACEFQLTFDLPPHTVNELLYQLAQAAENCQECWGNNKKCCGVKGNFKCWENDQEKECGTSQVSSETVNSPATAGAASVRRLIDARRRLAESASFYQDESSEIETADETKEPNANAGAGGDDATAVIGAAVGGAVGVILIIVVVAAVIVSRKKKADKVAPSQTVTVEDEDETVEQEKTVEQDKDTLLLESC